MHSLNLHLPDPLYAEIAKAAAARGLTVEAMAVGRLIEDFAVTGDVPEGFFTAEILEGIDAAREEAKRSGGISMDEMREVIAARSRAWRESHPA